MVLNSQKGKLRHPFKVFSIQMQQEIPKFPNATRFMFTNLLLIIPPNLLKYKKLGVNFDLRNNLQKHQSWKSTKGWMKMKSNEIISFCIF